MIELQPTDKNRRVIHKTPLARNGEQRGYIARWTNDIVYVRFDWGMAPVHREALEWEDPNEEPRIRKTYRAGRQRDKDSGCV